VRRRALDTLHRADELQLCMKKGDVFDGWTSTLPEFKPT